jgi:(1->4)-alpha-D-glucan 1-alpha-D-glucosylmutase
LLYQTLLGAWPLHPLKEERDWEEFRRRIHDYMLKAIREAKENTSWVNPNNDYEKAMAAFVRALLTPGDENRFLNDFMPFQRRIARLGFWNSLSQTFLKLTAPGVPDIYQGNDVWDFSLVDPDNRRAVDYEYRRAVFEQIRGSAHRERGSLSRMLETPEDDQLKLYLTWRTLCFRQERPDVFQQGEYLPLSVEGVRANHVVAFARRFGTTEVLVVAPRLVASLIGAGESAPVGAQIWQDTSLLVPCGGESKTYTNLFTGDEVEVAQAGKIAVAEMLSKFPVALYVADR